MKTKISYSLLAAAMACGIAQGQTAYTTPVGYVSLGKSTGAAVPASSDVYLSVPLDRPTVYAGLVSGVTGGNVISLQGTPGLGNLVTVPHVVKITSGPEEGFYALISANSASSVTVTLPPELDLASLASGNKIEISQAWTALSLVAGNTIPGDTELYLYGSIAAGLNRAPVFSLAWSGAEWLDQGTGDPINPVVYPGEMILMRSSATPVASLVVTGQVPTSKFTSVLTHFGSPGDAQDLELAVFSPVDITLAQSGLVASARENDELYLYDNTGSGINVAPSLSLAFNGVEYLDQGTGDPAPPTTVIKAATALLVRRAPNVSPAPVTGLWNFTPTYLPSL